MRAYGLLHFLLLLALGVHFLSAAPALSGAALALDALFLTTGLLSLGWLMEGRRWALAVEIPRLLWLAAWPASFDRLSGLPGLAAAVHGGFPAIAALSLPAVLWAWRGTATLQARAAG
jgi:hypothetical protein